MTLRTLALLLLTLGLQEDPAPLKTPWGRIEWKADSVLLYIEAWPKDGKVAMPRLNNPIGTVYSVNDPARTPLGFQPNLQDWSISRPKGGGDGPTTLLVEVKGRPRPAAEPVIVDPAADGSVVLPAHLAVPHGRLLRYEPQPHKNTIGYWADEADWVEWRLRVPKPGTYRIQLLQGCGKGQGGSAVKLAIAGQSLDYTVEDTGHFQNFVEKPVGTVTLDKAGEHVLEIRAVKKAKGAVMDVRQVRLDPV